MEWTCDVCRSYHWRETESNIYYLDKDDWQLEETKYLCKTCKNKLEKYVDKEMHKIYEQKKINLIKEWLKENK